MKLSLIAFTIAVIAAVGAYYELYVGKGTPAFAAVDISSEEDLEKFVLKVIEENPEQIISSLEGWYEQQAESDAADSAEVIAAIESNSMVPSVGGDDANLSIIEFFDYNCPYCRTSFQALNEVMERDKKLKIYFVEYPIFGPDSDQIASIALAIHQISPEKYFEFHEALMMKKAKISPSQARKAALALGIDETALDEAVKSDGVEKAILTLREYGQKLDVAGTPAFIIGETFIGGGLDSKRLTSLIEEARGE